MSTLQYILTRFRRPGRPALILSCDTLTLWAFMQCLFDRDFSVLTLRGKATPERLNEAWQIIFEQYCLLVENPQYDELLQAMRELVKLQSKLLVIRAATVGLSVQYNIQLINDLREVGFDYEFDKENQEAFLKDIENVIQAGKTISVKIKMQITEIERLQKIKGKGGDRKTFEDGIQIVSKYMGFRIDPKDISVKEYCSMQRSYTNYIEQQKIAYERAKNKVS